MSSFSFILFELSLPFHCAPFLTLHFFQVQDDYLDCYGDPKITGKIGTDIQEGKCSGLFVTAMQNSTKTQKEILLENYGCKSEKSVKIVREIYQDLKMIQLYKSFEEKSHEDLIDKISKIQSLNPQVFHNFLSKIYKRQQ